MSGKLIAIDVLHRYVDEELPEFSSVELNDVNQIDNFGNQPIHVACVRGDIEEVLTLLEAGADINAVGELGNTPLHEAIGQGYKNIVQLLLQQGASLELRNRFNQTPLDIALISGKNELAHILVLGLSL
jgi:ankyrin repeat protein